MNILFWNLDKKPLGEELRALSRIYDIDILILAECSMSDAEVLRALNPGTERKYVPPFDPTGRTGRIRFYTCLPRESLKPMHDTGGATIRQISPPLGSDIILVAVHLPSKLHSGPEDQAALCMRLASHIVSAESRLGHDRTLLVGDLNMNPFEAGVASADALHAVMDRRTAERTERTVQGRACKFFFNPMWSRLGDTSKGPPGTYYYSGSGQICFFWNTFDQLLLRPSLLPFFDDKNLKVVTSFNGTSLLSADGRPDRTRFSDHLPLYFRLTTEDNYR